MTIPKYDEQIKTWIQTVYHSVFIVFGQISDNKLQKCLKLSFEKEGRKEWAIPVRLNSLRKFNPKEPIKIIADNQKTRV